ncbi:DoxX family protein [Salaquimonas pukyongi]|uniref:DoxX family protein n=1 Tax=Salaquimonas pukyongi TaxID=2712698 RepID=UPI00096B8685|nr:DoxX family protein [Salaquimonas pukyongi]
MSTSAKLLAARILMSFIFIMAGLQKLGSIDGTAGYIAAYGFPASTLLAWAAAIFELVAGGFILAGFFTRTTAWALAAFCLFTGAVFHFDLGDQMQTILLMKNIAIAGGFVALAAVGPGTISVDGKRLR